MLKVCFKSVDYLLHIWISWHVCVICEEPASVITATVVWGGIPQVFPVECWNWHLLSRWILSWAGILYLSSGWERILTTPSLLQCSMRRNNSIQVWMLYPPSFYFGVCNSWDHDRVTGTTECTQTCTHLVISSSSVCLSPLNPHSSLSRCLNLTLAWMDNSNSLCVWSLPPFHWYHC